MQYSFDRFDDLSESQKEQMRDLIEKASEKLKSWQDQIDNGTHRQERLVPVLRPQGMPAMPARGQNENQRILLESQNIEIENAKKTIDTIIVSIPEGDRKNFIRKSFAKELIAGRFSRDRKDQFRDTRNDITGKQKEQGFTNVSLPELRDKKEAYKDKLRAYTEGRNDIVLDKDSHEKLSKLELYRQKMHQSHINKDDITKLDLDKT